MNVTTNLLVFGHWVQELGVQLGVVLGQRLMSVVIDQLYDGQEGQRLREAIAAVSVVDLDQFVVAAPPAGGDRSQVGGTESRELA